MFRRISAPFAYRHSGRLVVCHKGLDLLHSNRNWVVVAKDGITLGSDQQVVLDADAAKVVEFGQLVVVDKVGQKFTSCIVSFFEPIRSIRPNR